MTVLVTGASGFVGSHIVEQLSLRNIPARALVRKTSNTSFLRTLPNVELAEGAVEDRESFLKAARGATAIIHAAGLVKARGPEEFHRINTGGTENAVHAALENRNTVRRFVLLSSLAVAGPSDENGNPAPLGRAPSPVTAYGKSKLAAEEAALSAKDQIPVVILRPPAIYGPRDREILIFFQSINRGVLPLTNPVKNKLSMIYGPDCARACVAALEAEVPSGSIFYIDDGAPHTFAELIEQTERALGSRAWLRIPLPRSVVFAAATATEMYGRFRGQAVMFTRDKCNELFEQWVCDGKEARAALGWQPEVSFAEGVQRTADWYRNAGWL